MKNIVWQQPSGEIAVHNLPDSANSQDEAAALLASGSVDAGWIPVLFDLEEFPGPPQSTWVFENGVLTVNAAAKTAYLKSITLQYARTLRAEIFPLADRLQVSALVLANSSEAAALETYKEGLRNITLLDLSGATTEEGMRAIIFNAYKALRDALPPSVKLKFYQTLQ